MANGICHGHLPLIFPSDCFLDKKSLPLTKFLLNVTKVKNSLNMVSPFSLTNLVTVIDYGPFGTWLKPIFLVGLTQSKPDEEKTTQREDQAAAKDTFIGHFCAPWVPGFCEQHFCIFHNPLSDSGKESAIATNDEVIKDNVLPDSGNGNMVKHAG